MCSLNGLLCAAAIVEVLVGAVGDVVGSGDVVVVVTRWFWYSSI